MNVGGRWLLAVPIALFLGAVGVFLVALDRAEAPPAPRALEGAALPAIDLPRLGAAGERVSLAVAGGEPSVVNVFASWCTPCRIEHPVLQDIAATGAPMIGVLWKDSPSKGRAFLDELGDPFTAVGVDLTGDYGERLGVTGAPETFVLDADGVVLIHIPGPIDARMAQRTILPALAAARARAGLPPKPAAPEGARPSGA